jgi:hypothetical protein
MCHLQQNTVYCFFSFWSRDFSPLLFLGFALTVVTLLVEGLGFALGRLYVYIRYPDSLSDDF